MFRKAVFSLILSSITLSPVAASAEAFSELVIFSGSLSDTGNCASIGCSEFPDPPFFQNRSSNGPVAVDVLASLLRLSSEPSLHLVGPEQGTNYAFLGALAGGDRDIDLEAQVDAYLEPRGYVADPDALYFVFIGGNDVIAAVQEPDPAAAKAVLRGAVKGISRAVRDLVAAGARNLLVGNFIDLGIAPISRDLGITEIATLRTKQFNRLLSRQVKLLEFFLRIDILEFDFFEFGEDFLASAEQLGFTNTTDSCLAQPVGECDFDTFVFFNELFPTARIHQLMGNEIVSTAIRQLNDSFRRGKHHSDRRPGLAERAQ